MQKNPRKRFKILYFSCVLMLLFGFAQYAYAASFTLSPGSLELEKGNQYKINLNLSPGEDKVFTVKCDIMFPPELLEVTAFDLASGWMQLPTQGYDLVDNEEGRLIKSGGYPAGISENVLFGTVEFRAKKSAAGKIIIGGESFALDETNENILSPAQYTVNLTEKASTSEASEDTGVAERVAEPAVSQEDDTEEAASVYTKEDIRRLLLNASRQDGATQTPELATGSRESDIETSDRKALFDVIAEPAQRQENGSEGLLVYLYGGVGAALLGTIISFIIYINKSH